MLQYQANTNMGRVYVNDYTDTKLRTNAVDLQYYKSVPAYEEFTQKFNEHFSRTEEPKTQPKKEIKKMAIAKNKRGLFQVILIDPKEKKMLLNTVVISDSIEDVLLEVDAGKIIKDAGLAVADVDKIINILGQVRKTKKNKTGEVEIINEDTETKE